MQVQKVLRYAGLTLVFLYFFGGGITHFTATDMFVKTVPPYIPAPLAMVYISGLCEILGAIGLWTRRWRRAAGTGLFILTLCVTPANVYMWMNPQLFPGMSPDFLFWRLPAQAVLLALIWWSTRETASTAPGR
ncbi:MAG: hypothetical protein ABI661_01380 [Gammaproteobacteria bacterium]